MKRVYPLLALAIVGIFVMASAEGGITGMVSAKGKGHGKGGSKGGSSGGGNSINTFTGASGDSHDSRSCPSSVSDCGFVTSNMVCPAVQNCNLVGRGDVRLDCTETTEGSMVTIAIGEETITFMVESCSTITVEG